MEKPKSSSNQQQQLNFSGDLKSTNGSTSSKALPCAVPKWLSRIAGQQPNYSGMSTSHVRSLGSSFSDPGLIGVGCTPPKSNHLIIVGSSDGKAKTTIVENFPLPNYDIQKTSSSTLLVPKEVIGGVSYSASNSPISKRRGSSANMGSTTRTWSGSGAHALNLVEAASPSADLDYYNLLRQQEKSHSIYEKQNTNDNAMHHDNQSFYKEEKTTTNRFAKSSTTLIKESELSEVKNLKEKMSKVVPAGSRFPVATKASLDGLRKEAMKDTAEDALFAMDEHPTSNEEKHDSRSSERKTYRNGGVETATEFNKMTLTQQILETGLPQNWFFQTNESDTGVGRGIIGGRNHDIEQQQNKKKGKRPSNSHQMRELNAWAPQNL